MPLRLDSSLQDGRIWGAAIGASTLLISVVAVGLWMECSHRRFTSGRLPERRWIDGVSPVFLLAIVVLGASAFVGMLLLLAFLTFDG